jgi:predicted metal-dependent hydrolase
MTIFPRIRKAFFCCALVGWLLPVGHVFAQNHSMNCHDTLSPIHAELTKEDQNSANHLEVSRRLRPEVAIVLDICDADVTIKGSNTDMLRVSVDIGNPASKMTAGDYL